MDTLVKFFIFIAFVFFLINNAKADNLVYEEEIFSTTTITTEANPEL